MRTLGVHGFSQRLFYFHSQLPPLASYVLEHFDSILIALAIAHFILYSPFLTGITAGPAVVNSAAAAATEAAPTDSTPRAVPAFFVLAVTTTTCGNKWCHNCS